LDGAAKATPQPVTTAMPNPIANTSAHTCGMNLARGMNLAESMTTSPRYELPHIVGVFATRRRRSTPTAYRHIAAISADSRYCQPGAESSSSTRESFTHKTLIAS
jgi:hypothetical protein